MSGHGVLYTVVTAKLLVREYGSVLGCDISTVRPAPFGNLVRVCFDLHDDSASRDAALRHAQLFLPSREGFRHVVIAQSDRSFIVALCPDDHWDDEIIFAELQSALPHLFQARPFLSSVDGCSRLQSAAAGKGRPACAVPA